MAKFVCSGCGRELTAEQAFCPDCGRPAKAVQEPTQPAQAAPAQPVPPKPEAPVRPAPSYQQNPYPQMPYQPNPVFYQKTGKTGKGMGWIVFLRVILWITFAAIVITGTVLAIRWLYWEPLMSALYFFGSILLAFITVAGGMIALNNATNLRSIAMNTALTVELLQKLENKK